MTYLVILAFIGILGSLGGALFFMMRGSKDAEGDKQKSNNMFRALALRVGLSIFLFICILVAWKLGYVQPSGIRLGQ
jgi:Protein of unknown function (DUF2909)